jgi:hypothetical protein
MEGVARRRMRVIAGEAWPSMNFWIAASPRSSQ